MQSCEQVLCAGDLIVTCVSLDKWSLTIQCHTPSCALYSGKMKPAKPWPLLPSTALPSPLPTTLISPPALYATITGTRPCSVRVSLSKHKQRALARGLYAFESLSPSSCVFFFASSSLHTLFRFVFLPRKCDNGSHVCVP